MDALSKQRQALRDHVKRTTNPQDTLRGYTCPHCSQLGAHFEDRCPLKPFIGVPEVQRKAMQEAALAEAMGPERAGCTTTPRPTPPGFISGTELQCMIRTREDVPPCLRCSVCTLLSTDPVWCQVCDAIACSTCLAPPDEQWVCPYCETANEENFHVVTALRDLCRAWTRAVTLAVDAKVGLL